MVRLLKIALSLLTLLACSGRDASAWQKNGAQSLWRATVTSNQAALYAGLSATSKVVTILSQGDAVTIDLEITQGDGKWYRVTTSGQTNNAGFVSGKDLNFQASSAVAFWEFVQPPEPVAPTDADSPEKKIRSAFAETSRGKIEGDIKSFFISKFGSTLPVSAFGQTRLHSRMGFDHRNGIDVALSPDSLEGRALLGKLRGFGVPFIAFRKAIPGVATGAHIHVGRPSPRR